MTPPSTSSLHVSTTVLVLFSSVTLIFTYFFLGANRNSGFLPFDKVQATTQTTHAIRQRLWSSYILSFPILVVPFSTREGIYFFHRTKENFLPFFCRTNYLLIYYYQYNDAFFGVTTLVGFSHVPSVTLQVWFFPFGVGRAFSTSLHVSIVFSASSVESCIDPGLNSPARSSLGFKALMWL